MPKPNAIACLLAAALFTLPARVHAASRDYRFDLVHTQVLVSASHVGYSHPLGRLHVKSGWFRFDADDWTQAKVDVLIDAASIDMGDAKWNEAMRSRDFLASERYPTAHYVSTRVEKTGDNQGTAHGTLTLLGMTRPLDLQITFNRAGADPYTLKWTAGFSATAQLRRSDFGIKKYLPDIGDMVTIHVEAEGLRDGEAQGQSERAVDNASSNDSIRDH
ncbi:MAG: polyisoprenoid-binding protein [Gammaproteobacteria bacterium]|nr:MAG: polyisoprenoid-binding protein [Gammaproteobacteria bacterium]